MLSSIAENSFLLFITFMQLNKVCSTPNSLNEFCPLASVVVMSWFPPKEQPYINAFNACLAYVGMTLAYMITVPVSSALGSWRGPLILFGVYSFAVALLWVIFGKVKAASEPQDASMPESNQAPVKKESGIVQAVKRKEVWILAICLIGVQWTFNTFTSYLPVYFQEIRGMDAASASAITGAFPLIGILGGLATGIGMGALGLRKIFTWPLFLLMFLGAIGSVTISNVPLLYLSVGLIGFGAAGFTPVYCQVAMDLKGMTPKAVGGALAIMLGLANLVGYFCPMVFGVLMPMFGMATTMMILGSIMLISFAVSFMLPETGPKAKNRELSEING